MKIYLDLLPEEKKEKIKKDKDFLKVIRQEIIFSIPVLSLFAILLVTSITQNMVGESVGDASETGKLQKDYEELRSFESKFGETNSKTSDVFKIQKDHINWMNFLYKLDKIIPENVYLSGITTDDYIISLAGKAKTREDFLKFQNNIKSESCFSNLNVPLSSLVSKENVEFQIDFEISRECLSGK